MRRPELIVRFFELAYEAFCCGTAFAPWFLESTIFVCVKIFGVEDASRFAELRDIFLPPFLGVVDEPPPTRRPRFSTPL